MSEIKIPFNDWSKERLFMKRCTSRTKKYGEVGDTFTVNVKGFIGDNDKKFRITHIERVSLGFVADKLYKLEGASSTREFIKVE